MYEKGEGGFRKTMTRPSIESTASGLLHRLKIETANGREQAVKSKRLCFVMGIGERDLRRAVEHIRRTRPDALCSDSVHGYWLAANGDEKREAARRLRKHGIAELVEARRMGDKFSADEIENEILRGLEPQGEKEK